MTSVLSPVLLRRSWIAMPVESPRASSSEEFRRCPAGQAGVRSFAALHRCVLMRFPVKTIHRHVGRPLSMRSDFQVEMQNGVILGSVQ